MFFDRPVVDIIKARSSWRTYRDEALGVDIAKKLEEFMASHGTGPFGSNMRLVLLSKTEEDRSALKGTGTYGFIRGASAFIVGAVRSGAMCFEDYGYAMEEIILYATSLDLGTCWLGGSFKKSGFAKAVSAEADEILPAVTPVGHRAGNRRLLDRFVRWSAGSKNRKPWEELFFSGQFSAPLSREDAGVYADPLEMVRLAPSASNKQPWRIVRETDHSAFHFFIKRTGIYMKGADLMKMADLQRIDMGIAMCHFELCAVEAGLKGAWAVIQSPFDTLPDNVEYRCSWIES